MADITVDCIFDRTVPALGFAKYYDLVITTPATADANDTLTFTAAQYGTVIGVQAYEQTGNVLEAYAIALSTGTYTITCGTGTNKVRMYVVKLRR